MKTILIRRSGTIIGTAILAIWGTSLVVRMTVGAPIPQGVPNSGIGPVPTAMPTLAALRMPHRDPFEAEVAAAASPAASPGPQGRGRAGSSIADTTVPDVGAVGGGGAVIATIVSGENSFALVEQGSIVQVARVGDTFQGSRIKTITDRNVTLENGVRISMDDSRRSAGSDAALAGAADTAPGPLSSPLIRSQDGQPPFSPYSSQPPPPPSSTGAQRAPSPSPTLSVSGFGMPVLTYPNGNSVTPMPQPSANPASLATPTVIPL